MESTLVTEDPQITGCCEAFPSLLTKAGEHAVVQVNDTARLRATWTWLLGLWLTASGHRERNAPEFERFTSISEAGPPIRPAKSGS